MGVEKIYKVELHRNNGGWGGHHVETKSYHSTRLSAERYIEWYEENLDRIPGYDYFFFIEELDLISDESSFMPGLS